MFKWLYLFTSAKSAQYVQILLLGHKQTSGIPRGMADCRFAWVRHCSCICLLATVQKTNPMIISLQQPSVSLR